MKLSTPLINATRPKPADIQTLFSNITPRYDLLNTLLSFRLDRAWRRHAVRVGLEKGARAILDIGTGTGKLLNAFLERGHFDYAVGIDLSARMLEKARHDGNGALALFACGNALSLPFKDRSFDLIVSSFTMRSIPDLKEFFAELYRVSTCGARTVLLELTRPETSWLKVLYYPYLHFYIPFLGWLLTGDGNAYRFLADSIGTFKGNDEVTALMSEAGFEPGGVGRLTGGLATLFIAEKPC